MTNLFYSRVGISPTCPCCGNANETVLHVFFDCTSSFQVWYKLVPLDWITNFFSFVNCKIGFSKTLVKDGMEFLSLSGKHPS